MPRKNPVLLRRGPLSGKVEALTNYRYINNGQTIKVVGDGKHGVTGDFDTLMLEELISDDAPDIVGILDGAAEGDTLLPDERQQIRNFRERLRDACLRHNERIDKQA